MSKKKRLNLKKFIPFCIVCVLIICGLVFGISKLIGKKPVDPIEICEHEYKQGVCTKCGEVDPNYVPNPKLSWPDTTTSEDSYPLKVSDDDYLVLVNKTHALSETYVPDDLREVKYYNPSTGNVKMGTRMVRSEVADAFEKLHEDAKESCGYDIILISGYRPYEYQTILYNNYSANYGQEEADKFSARPGTSEHQSGWALDVGTPYEYLDSFTGTKEASWLKENCYKYGFILRYQDGTETEVGAITGYIAESWHIRYVGVDAAKIMYENNLTLEEYLEAIYDAKNE